ncbi:putative bifunctional diguanylate cyclase/phosphodiesterase [Patulibacter defluvii]|uniref:putative bifunctional diguanylate cyclase/phosphodiesterase n=1 Tax=Patulibacter defluvii TaxID=3095358 RepID=UPI002A7582A4|nr:EAL domain-containing protein [Patulibacter sp. DM4]
MDGGAAPPTPRGAELIAGWAIRFSEAGPDRFAEAAREAAAALAAGLDVDRVILYLARDGTDRAVLVEWTADGVAPRMDEAPRAIREPLAWRDARFDAGEPVVIDDVTALPAEAARERELLEAGGVAACVVVPLGRTPNAPGPERRLSRHSALAVDSTRGPRHWSDEERTVLEAAGRIAAAAYSYARALEAAAESHRWHQALFHHARDAIFLADPGSGVIVDVNAAGEELIGSGRDQIVGRPFLDLHPEDDQPSRAAAFTKRARGRTGAPTRGTVLHRDGRRIPVEITAGIVEHDGRRVLQGLFRDVSERQEAAASMHRLAYLDPVTGLGNRAAMGEHLAGALGEAAEDGSVAVVFLDLDAFKRVNDALGHQTGDRLLSEIGERLRTVLGPAAPPEGAAAFRYGGDDFVLVLPGADEQRARAVVAQIEAELTRPVVLDENHEVAVRTNSGIALGPRDGTTVDDLVRAADLAMLAAQDAGSGSEVFAPRLADRARVRMAIEERLPRALAEGRLQVVYQPLVHLVTGAVVGVETLARWVDEDLGPVAPSDFVPVAAATGAIAQLGRVVLDRTLRQAATWRAAGTAAPAAINVSAEELRSLDYATLVLERLEHHGLPADALEIEISEATMLEHDADAIDTLRRLQEAGVRLALDDFGARFSSLAHLRNVRLDHIKLDGDLVQRVTESGTDRAIVRAIVQVAAELDAAVTAEGIERQETIAALLELGVEIGQGHALARPGDADAISARMERRS